MKPMAAAFLLVPKCGFLGFRRFLLKKNKKIKKTTNRDDGKNLNV